MILKEITRSYKDKYCISCFNKMKMNNFHELIHKDICLCQKCLEEFSPKIVEEKISNVKGLFFYTYNDKIREKIYTLKGCGDIELAKAFLNYYYFELNLRYKNYVIVPSPSSLKADDVRGFNHVIEIFKVLKLPIVRCIEKSGDFKQSDLSKEEREKICEKLVIKNTEKIRNKNVLFVDDIFTTGSTLKACLKLIKTAHPRRIKFLIIAKVDKNKK